MPSEQFVNDIFDATEIASTGAGDYLPILRQASGERLLRKIKTTSWGASLTFSVSQITATGTPDSTTFLRGDGAWAVATASLTGLLSDRGNFDASGNTFPSSGGSGTAGAILQGNLWTISIAGTLGGHAVTAGDVVRALVDTPGQTDGNWAITENNFGYVAENSANKVTAFSTPTDVQYPSAKLVSDQLGLKQNSITFGTGVQTALSVNIGSAGAAVLNGGVLGTPSSGVATNITGLPEGGLSLTDIATNNASTSKHGFLLKLDNNSAHYMDGTGAWSTPAGGGITIGTTTITGGTDTRSLYNNAGVVGERVVTGTGNAVLSASPALTGTMAIAALTASGIVQVNNQLKLSNGQTYILDGNSSLRILGSGGGWTIPVSSQRFIAASFSGGTVGYQFGTSDTGDTGIYKLSIGVVRPGGNTDDNTGYFTDAGYSRVVTQFDKTSDTALAAITGLSSPLVAGSSYKFIVTLHVAAGAVGGEVIDMGGGTATATAFVSEVKVLANTTNVFSETSRQTSLTGASAGIAGDTSYFITIEGLITVNGAGTFKPRISQKVSNGTATSVLVGSEMIVRLVP